MKPKVGQCYYAPRGRGFRIYRYTSVTATTSTASPVPDEPIYFDREEVRKRVYQLNGWNFNKRKNNNEQHANSSAR